MPRGASLIVATTISALALLPGGCLVQGEPDPAVVSVSLGLGGSPKGGLVQPNETIDLSVRPCFVGLRVTAPDLPAPVTTAWACEPGEDPGAEVALEVLVDPGDDREISVVAFLSEDGTPITFYGQTVEDLTSGPVDLTLEAEELPFGSVDGFITGTDRDVAAVRLTDLETGVRFPAAPATAQGGGFHFNMANLPQGRFFGLTIILVGGDEIEIVDCPVYVTQGSVRVLNVDAANHSC